MELVLEWVPQAGQVLFRQHVAEQFQQLLNEGVERNVAAGQAVLRAKPLTVACKPCIGRATAPALFITALSLAEGETLRRLLHLRLAGTSSGLRLRRLDGSVLDESPV